MLKVIERVKTVKTMFTNMLNICTTCFMTKVCFSCQMSLFYVKMSQNVTWITKISPIRTYVLLKALKVSKCVKTCLRYVEYVYCVFHNRCVFTCQNVIKCSCFIKSARK